MFLSVNMLLSSHLTVPEGQCGGSERNVTLIEQELCEQQKDCLTERRLMCRLRGKQLCTANYMTSNTRHADQTPEYGTEGGKKRTKIDNVSRRMKRQKQTKKERQEPQMRTRMFKWHTNDMLFLQECSMKYYRSRFPLSTEYQDELLHLTNCRYCIPQCHAQNFHLESNIQTRSKIIALAY